MSQKKVLYLLLMLSYSSFSQVTLTADGEGNTYELINSVLAPNYNVVEVPDCNHVSFGRHIDEIFDADLNKHVFRFIIHTENDNDRCQKFDRQRNEIKAYDKSPENLLGVVGERVIYKWKMKVDKDFQASPNFTHLHQLKSVGGDYSSIPMYTLTARKGNPDKLELRYTNTNSQSTIKKVDLSLLKGTWVEITEDISYGSNKNYSLIIKRVDNQNTVFEYSNNNTINWQNGAEFVRPKWGIYRSLLNVADLRDEEVLFADFSIEQVSPLSIEELSQNTQTIKTYPNPVKKRLFIKETNEHPFNSINIFDVMGKLILVKKSTIKDSIDVSNLNKGMYYFIFKVDQKIVSRNTIIIN
ncbi:putative secreted protein (Por secretion system target) [Lutibacter sp. Hel_I_33_5]|uniref:T9SS type A sorting domain-containing protein n=1 Tax=Lutibacter sp. Hel_I_33_5 TaxID=1566289 RepID=UPI0011A8A7D0|nr:T9SS type A sorting domain-containing protein [Lutibacter sp. Hel_I_33_5]TVZ57084.1 putative secreted protein (Por secretion system target) [Lutibacter sp. Hel_I_33_5]